MRSLKRLSAFCLCALLLVVGLPPEALRAAGQVRRASPRGTPLRPAGRHAGALPTQLRPARLSLALPPSSAPPGPALTAPVASIPNIAPENSRGVARLSFSEQSGATGSAGQGPGQTGAGPASGQAASNEALVQRARLLFDGQVPAFAPDPVPLSPVTVKSRWDRLWFKLGRGTGRLLPRKVSAWLLAPPRPKTQFDPDPFGGPKAKNTGFLGAIAYGLHWGMNLLGISAVFQYAVKPLLGLFPWQLYASDTILEKTGRVELLVGFGPQAIDQAISQSPWSFLFLEVPLASAYEEVVFRFLNFTTVFLILTAIRPVTSWLSQKLQNLPNIFKVRETVQLLLGLAGKISGQAFWGAAFLSAVSFAMAHFPAWGVNPYTFLVHLSLGLGLAWAGYRMHGPFLGLTTAITAHLAYNLLGLLGILLGGYLLFPLAGQVYGILLATLSAAYLYFSWRSYRKAKKAALVEAGDRTPSLGAFLWIPKAAISLLTASLLALGLFVSLGGGARSPHFHSSLPVKNSGAARVWKIQDVATGGQAAGANKKADKKNAAEDSAKTPADWPGVIAKAKPAVVKILTPRGRTGSGFVVNQEGLIVTNAHVAAGAGPGGTTRIVFPDGEVEEAAIVALNHDKDLAFLQLPENPNGWPHLDLADAEKILEGEAVIALGHPLDLPFTITGGRVSGLGSRGDIYVDHIQTDAALNPGNSGGPLINRSGEVIGVNTQIRSFTGGNMGLGFAVSVADLKAALEQFKATGNINTSWLGVIIDQTNPVPPKQGVAIEQVRPGSPADQAGLRSGDVIMGFVKTEKGQETRMLLAADNPGRAMGTLAQTLALKKPGEKLTLLVARGDDAQPVEVTLGDKQ